MKIDRLLSMVILFINRKKITAKELSDYFGVSIKTIRRDIDTLTIAGIPIYSESGPTGGYFIHKDFALNRSVFTNEEYNLLHDLITGIERSIVNPLTASVFNKIVQHRTMHSQNAPNLIIDIMPWVDKNNTSSILQLIMAGIEAHQIIEFDYYKPGSMKHRRSVKPIRIVLKGSSWYLKAYCNYSKDYRLFKMTRMVDVELTNDTFEPISDNVSPEDYYNEWYGLENDKPIKVRFFQPIYGQLEHFISIVDIKWDQPYFDYDLYFKLDDWLLRTLVSFGSHVLILDEKVKNGVSQNDKKKSLKCMKKINIGDSMVSTLLCHNNFINSKQ